MDKIISPIRLISFLIRLVHSSKIAMNEEYMACQEHSGYHKFLASTVMLHYQLQRFKPCLFESLLENNIPEIKQCS